MWKSFIVVQIITEKYTYKHGMYSVQHYWSLAHRADKFVPSSVGEIIRNSHWPSRNHPNIGILKFGLSKWIYYRIIFLFESASYFRESQLQYIPGLGPVGMPQGENHMSDYLRYTYFVCFMPALSPFKQPNIWFKTLFAAFHQTDSLFTPQSCKNYLPY